MAVGGREGGGAVGDPRAGLGHAEGSRRRIVSSGTRGKPVSSHAGRAASQGVASLLWQAGGRHAAGVWKLGQAELGGRGSAGDIS